MEKRKLTNAELREWGERLNPDGDWEGVTPQMVYRLMVETAGGSWESGEAGWDFDLSDAQRLIELMGGVSHLNS